LVVAGLEIEGAWESEAFYLANIVW